MGLRRFARTSLFALALALVQSGAALAVDPVNETRSTSGCEQIACPTVGPSPLTMLNTPRGTPASSSTRAKRYPLRGAISLGFNTIVQPVAIAGATLQTI